MEPDPNLYASGLTFDCTACGKCCSNHTDYAYVYLTDQDLDAIPEHLEKTEKDFLSKYARKKQGHWVLKDSGDSCIFLEKNGKCGVYDARPLQCRTFPFWPENLNEKIWNQEIKKDCPGTSANKIVSRDDIETFLEWEEDECYPTL